MLSYYASYFCGNCYTFLDSWWIEITVFEIESFRNILNVFTVPLEQMNASVDASNVEYYFYFFCYYYLQTILLAFE